ncbi:hypothetical protein MD484_g512, partial [Candolleomyces efflorescens]
MPISFSSHAAHAYNTMEKRVLNALNQDLGDEILETDAAWSASLYSNLTETATIESYLEKSGEYLNGKWVRMPESFKSKSELCGALCHIINSILEHFRVSRSDATRLAVDIHEAPFKPTDAGSIGMFASPSVVIKASGPSFYPPKGAPIGFPNVSACFTVKSDCEADHVLDDLAVTTASARQMFAHQPNRFFVRSLIVTERHARLFHFDRSGAQYSPILNIHEDPDQFIRLILGLCSTDEATLGLDDSIEWTISSGGTKTGGTLRTVGPKDTIVTYNLIADEPPFVRSGIQGRGTICWPVKNASGDKFIVKDHWLAGSGTPEYELLAEAKGLPGVCQMVSYEGNRAETKNFRGTTQLVCNRRAIRTVMKAYGSSIGKFSCVEEVLSALRDAIAAHRALLSRGVIHRDISLNNILFGSPGAEKGDRGVLIDFGIAFKCQQLIAEHRADFKTGTRMFQSLMVLKTWEMEQNEISAHDYLDDLEGYFWVLAYLLFTHKADGTRAPENFMRTHVFSWPHAIPFIAYSMKFDFLYSRRIEKSAKEDMDEGWRDACMDLFLSFRECMSKLAKEKDDLFYQKQDETELAGALPNRFSSLLKHVDEHYDYVLGLFDAALEKVNQVPKASQPREREASVPSPESTPIDTPTAALTTTEDVAVAPSNTEHDSSCSDQSTLTSPCDVRKPVILAPSSRSSKRCSEEAELDDAPADVKRVCPPSRRSLRAVVNPTVHIFSSVYRYCIKWF